METIKAIKRIKGKDGCHVVSSHLWELLRTCLKHPSAGLGLIDNQQQHSHAHQGKQLSIPPQLTASANQGSCLFYNMRSSPFLYAFMHVCVRAHVIFLHASHIAVKYKSSMLSRKRRQMLSDNTGSPSGPPVVEQYEARPKLVLIHFQSMHV